MNAWWLSLSALEQGLFCVAIPATMLLVLQTLMLLFGFHGHVEGDVSGHDGLDQHDNQWGNNETSTGHGHDGPSAGGHSGNFFAGLKLFTLRGIIAFLSIFGWGSLWLLSVGLHPILALFLGIFMGCWAMALIAVLLKLALQLQYDGTMDMHNALGVSGSVYLTIPPNRQSTGKVSVLVQQQLSEFEAVTDDPESIQTGSEVTVVGISGQSVLVVIRKQVSAP
jgi:hypothetical protein